MVTVTGTLLTIDGLIDPGSTVSFMLCGYGSISPKAHGIGGPDTGSLSGATATAATPVPPATAFSIQLQPNDIIFPPGTYYTATVRNGNGDILQTNAYRFSSGPAIDLDFTDPIDPNQPPPPLPPQLSNQLITVPFSPTPHFDGSLLTAWQIFLSADVTSSTCTGCVTGNLYTMIVTQDPAGGHAFAWPPNFANATSVNPDPSASTIQTFIAASDGNLYAVAPGTYWS
jgi:hypothetical protein